MPRTRQLGRSGGRTAPNATPLERYNRLDWHDKFICWQYYLWISTSGTEGWNIAEVGSVFHQRTSAYLDSLGGPSWFRHRARSMVTLAQAFADSEQDPPYLQPRDERGGGGRPTQQTPPRQPPMMPTTPVRTPPPVVLQLELVLWLLTI
jgi:hypothetical protein